MLLSSQLGAKFHDISPEISEGTAVFPGDKPFSRKISMDFEKGDGLVLSSIETTVHIGAHVDAPAHYHPQGQSMEGRKIEYYLGPCQVITVKLGAGERIRPRHIENISVLAPRILFKTESYNDSRKWRSDFNALSSDLVEYLVRKDVILVGIDTPSIDLAEDKQLESHQAVFRNDLAILEGIELNNVTDGVYFLIALPLKLKGCDASPVRAVLVEYERKNG